MKLFELKSYPRSIMPQIHAKDLKGKYDFVKAKVNLKDMIPVQKERLQKEYEDAISKVKNNCAKPIMLDKHGKIVNGHHRHDAYRDLGFDKVKVIVVNATLDDLIQAFSEEAGGGGAGGGGAAGGAGGATGGTSGGDGGGTSSSGDGGSADSGDTGSSDSAPTTSGSMRGGFFLGSMSPYKKKKKKKKKSNFQFGKGVYKESDLLVNLGLLESTPNFDFEWEEARRYPEFEKLGKEVWIEMAKRGKEVEITSAKDINNTDAASPESFYELDPEKQKRAMQALSRGKMEMPIVAQYSDGHKELIGGNTRLTYAMLRQGKAKIWLFNVPDSIAENATTWKKFDVNLGYRANMYAWLLQQNYNLRKAGQEEIPKIKADDAFTKAMLDAGVTPEQLTQARNVDHERRKEADDMWAKSWRSGNNAKGIVRNERKKYGKGIFETIEAMQDLQALLKAIDEDVQEGEVFPINKAAPGEKRVGYPPYFSDAEAERAAEEFKNQAPIDQEDGVLLTSEDGKNYRIFKNEGESQHFAKDEIYLVNDEETNPTEYIDKHGYDKVEELLYHHSKRGYYVENIDDGFDDIVEYYDEIHPIVIQAWKSVYPNIPLKAIDNEDLYMQYTTADEYLPHGGNGKDFYLSLGVQYMGDEEPPMGYINVGDAYAGNYKGVVSKIIAALFEWLEKQHPNMGVRELGIHMNRNTEAWNAIAQKVGAQLEKRGYYENFADGKKKGKSRPGRVKRAGASCKGSVSSLRAKAKKYSGERGKMYHWCANMKGGKKKK